MYSKNDISYGINYVSVSHITVMSELSGYLRIKPR